MKDHINTWGWRKQRERPSQIPRLRQPPALMQDWSIIRKALSSKRKLRDLNHSVSSNELVIQITSFLIKHEDPPSGASAQDISPHTFATVCQTITQTSCKRVKKEEALHRCRKDQVLQLASKVHYNMCQATVWRVLFAAVSLTMQIVIDEAGMI